MDFITMVIRRLCRHVSNFAKRWTQSFERIELPMLQTGMKRSCV